MILITSYESLADAAFAAAVDVQLKLEGRSTGLENFQKFAKLLKEPKVPGSEYKLLTDSRNLPLYKAAWADAHGQQEVKSTVLLANISEFLQRAVAGFDSLNREDKQRLANFCLALNRAFLEENAKSYTTAYSARAMHASS